MAKPVDKASDASSTFYQWLLADIAKGLMVPWWMFCGNAVNYGEHWSDGVGAPLPAEHRDGG